MRCQDRTRLPACKSRLYADRPCRRPEAQTVLKKSNCLNFQVEHDGRHHPVQNSKPCRKLRLVMLDWLGAPTWHFARSILNATTGHSNSGSMGPDFDIDESGGIGARPRLGGSTELQARCHGTARRAQRHRLEGGTSRDDRARSWVSA